MPPGPELAAKRPMRRICPSLSLGLLLTLSSCALGTSLDRDGSGGAASDRDTHEDLGDDAGEDATVAAATSSHAAGPASTSNAAATSSSGGAGLCCSATTSPGCADSTVEACVCAADDYCCQTAWDETCVSLVEAEACGSCGGQGGGGAPPATTSSAATTGGGAASACCMPRNEPGCPSDAAVQDCVCALDAYCCAIEWDDLCVDQITSFACGTCGP